MTFAGKQIDIMDDVWTSSHLPNVMMISDFESLPDESPTETRCDQFKERRGSAIAVSCSK